MQNQSGFPMADINLDKKKEERIMKTHIPGFDELFAEGGIPQRNSVLVAGGTGTGKSTFCRQICYNLVSQGKHCMYVSFEESIEKIAFLITETEPIPIRFSDTGIEEFLADGILVLYNIQRGDKRENAIEVFKMRYSNHQKKVFSLNISPQGIKVYPDRQVMLPNHNNDVEYKERIK